MRSGSDQVSVLIINSLLLNNAIICLLNSPFLYKNGGFNCGTVLILTKKRGGPTEDIQLEYWSDGVMEYWGIGVLGYWGNGLYFL